MLSSKQIEHNKKKFKEVNLTYGVLTPELEEFLGDEIYNSPSSTTISSFGAYPGGLIEYIFLACKYSVQLNEFLPVKLKLEKDLIMKTVVLLQIGKVGMFILNDNKWRIDNLGEMYKFKEDDVSLKSTEKSIFLCQKFGVSLTEDQFQTMLNFEKDDSDLMSKHHSTTLTNIVKLGFKMAVMEMKM